MNSLEDYQAVVAAIDQGSLTAAARHLGRSLQSVSRSVAQVEKSLGAELIQRTTRRLRPTEAGLRFHARLRAALADIEAAQVEAAESATAIGGTLRVGGPMVFAPVYLVPALAAFLLRHPGISLDLRLANEYADLIAERLDLSVRVGELEDSSLRMRRIAMVRRVTIASPAYLAEHGRPRTPRELAGHSCVIRTSAKDATEWTYVRGSVQERVRVAGRLATSSADACNEAVARGMGIGLAQTWQVRPLLDQGRVELILTEFEPPPAPVSLVWPAGGALPARTRLLIEFLASRLAAEQW